MYSVFQKKISKSKNEQPPLKWEIFTSFSALMHRLVHVFHCLVQFLHHFQGAEGLLKAVFYEIYTFFYFNQFHLKLNFLTLWNALYN